MAGLRCRVQQAACRPGADTRAGRRRTASKRSRRPAPRRKRTLARGEPRARGRGHRARRRARLSPGGARRERAATPHAGPFTPSLVLRALTPEAVEAAAAELAERLLQILHAGHGDDLLALEAAVDHAVVLAVLALPHHVLARQVLHHVRAAVLVGVRLEVFDRTVGVDLPDVALAVAVRVHEPVLHDPAGEPIAHVQRAVAVAVEALALHRPAAVEEQLHVGAPLAVRDALLRGGRALRVEARQHVRSAVAALVLRLPDHGLAREPGKGIELAVVVAVGRLLYEPARGVEALLEIEAAAELRVLAHGLRLAVREGGDAVGLAVEVAVLLLRGDLVLRVDGEPQVGPAVAVLVLRGLLAAARSALGLLLADAVEVVVLLDEGGLATGIGLHQIGLAVAIAIALALHELARREARERLAAAVAVLVGLDPDRFAVGAEARDHVGL